MNKKYTTLSRHHIGFEDGKSVYAVIIVVDTTEDIPEPEPDWVRGSICLINQGHQFRSLNGKGEWV